MEYKSLITLCIVWVYLTSNTLGYTIDDCAKVINSAGTSEKIKLHDEEIEIRRMSFMASYGYPR